LVFHCLMDSNNIRVPLIGMVCSCSYAIFGKIILIKGLLYHCFIHIYNSKSYPQIFYKSYFPYHDNSCLQIIWFIDFPVWCYYYWKHWKMLILFFRLNINYLLLDSDSIKRCKMGLGYQSILSKAKYSSIANNLLAHFNIFKHFFTAHYDLLYSGILLRERWLKQENGYQISLLLVYFRCIYHLIIYVCLFTSFLLIQAQ
jgi:hypothetical protein